MENWFDDHFEDSRANLIWLVLGQLFWFYSMLMIPFGNPFDEEQK